MKKYIKSTEEPRVNINIDWDAFLDYFGIDWNDLMRGENEYSDYDVESFLGMAAESVQEAYPNLSLQEFVDEVVSYATDIEHVSDYCAGVGISDAGLLMGIEENPQMVINVCKEYYEGE